MKTTRAFTLIELLVVISIISMLSSVVLASLKPIRAQARDAARKQEIHQLDIAIQQYIADKGYPPELSGCFAQVSTPNLSQISGCIAVSTDGLAGFPNNPTTPWGKLLKQLSPYLPNIPSDPCSSGCTSTDGTPIAYTYMAPPAVQYYSSGSNSNYEISSALESGPDASGNTGEPVSLGALSAPSAPTNLLATAVLAMPDYRYGQTYDTRVSWGASTVGSGGTSIAGYIPEVTGGVAMDMTSNLYASVNSHNTTLPTGPWCWRVSAVDNNGHVSMKSAQACASIP